MQIESWEDRSGLETPGPQSFGFVYFSDGVRVGYSSQTADHLPVWQPRTNGGGKYQEATTYQFLTAIKFLYGKGVLTDEDLTQLRAELRVAIEV